MKEEDQEKLSVEEKLLVSAEEVFLDKGFDKTRTVDIAALAGVNHAMLHYYFRTKEKLFEKVLHKKMEEISNQIISVLESSNLSFEENLRVAIQKHFDFLNKDKRLPLFIYREFLSNTERMQRHVYMIKPLVQRVLNFCQAGINAGVSSGKYRQMAPEHLLYNIVSLNLSAFLVLQSLKNGVQIPDAIIQSFLETRRSENVEVVLRSLYK
ncbi:MAG: TetR/AcrR family transcriptional regulator [Bacteroidaceae bacterium]